MRIVYVLGLAAVAVLGALFFSMVRSAPPSLEAARIYDTPRPVAEFSLESTAGEMATPASLKGQWTFLFTGYTYCPDICPTTMAALKGHWSELTSVSDLPIKVWMISVDPKRDSLTQLAPYVGFFGEDFIGIRGEHPQLYPFVTSIGMMYSVPEEHETNYEVAHSAAIVLVNPEGRQHAIFQPISRPGQYTTINPKFMVSDFKKIVQAYR